MINKNVNSIISIVEKSNNVPGSCTGCCYRMFVDNTAKSCPETKEHSLMCNNPKTKDLIYKDITEQL